MKRLLIDLSWSFMSENKNYLKSVGQIVFWIWSVTCLIFSTHVFIHFVHFFHPLSKYMQNITWTCLKFSLLESKETISSSIVNNVIVQNKISPTHSPNFDKPNQIEAMMIFYMWTFFSHKWWMAYNYENGESQNF